MVRNARRRVSNHEAPSFETAGFGGLLRMRRGSSKPIDNHRKLG
jgi:hypothetical protein